MKDQLTGILLLGMIMVVNACDKMDKRCPLDPHKAINIVNQSTRNIRFEFYWNYPDTAIGEYNPLGQADQGLLKPGMNFKRSVGRYTCWEAFFIYKDKEWIYFF